MIKFGNFLEEKKVEEETGTAAVAGAGDDSSTVVVKKKKKELDEISSDLLKRYADKATTQSAKDAMSGDKKRFDKAMKRARPIAKAQQKVSDRKGDEIVKKHDPTYKKESVDFSLEEGYEKITPGVKGMAQRVHDAIKKGGFPKNRAHQMALDDSERALKQYHGKDWRKRLDVKESVEVTEAVLSHEIKKHWQKCGSELKKYGATKGGIDKKAFQDIGHMFDFTTRVKDSSDGYNSQKILNAIFQNDTDVRDKMMDIVTNCLGTKWRSSRPTPKEIFGKYMVEGVEMNEDKEVNELTRKTLSSYKKKASDQVGSTMKRDMDVKKVDKRQSGIAKATKKIDQKNRDMATAPFKDPKERGTRKDDYGNTVKDKNRAKFLAKKGMKEENVHEDIMGQINSLLNKAKNAVTKQPANKQWKDPDNTPSTQKATPGYKSSVVKTKAYKNPNAGINPAATSIPKASQPAPKASTSMNPIRLNMSMEHEGEAIAEQKTTYVFDKNTGHVKRVYANPAIAEKQNPGEPSKVIKEDVDEALKTDTKIKMARDKLVRQMKKQGKSQADIDKACRMNFPSLYEAMSPKAKAKRFKDIAKAAKKVDRDNAKAARAARRDAKRGIAKDRDYMDEGYNDAPKSSKVTSANNPEVSAYDDMDRKGRPSISGFMNLQTWMSIHGISAKYQKELVNMLNKAGKGKQVKIPAKMKADYDAEYKKEGKPTHDLWIELK